jgi:hypothetical protein
MGTTVQLRPRSARALGVGLVVVAAIGLVSAASDGVDVLLTYGAPVVHFGLLGWAAFWRPYVEVSDGGVTVANTLRTVMVPWPSIEEVEGRYGLQLRTAYGSVTAWSASAPSGRRRSRGEDSDAAQVVTSRLEALRVAGHLDDPRLETPRLRATWHRELLVAIGVLVLASAVLPLVA